MYSCKTAEFLSCRRKANRSATPQCQEDKHFCDYSKHCTFKNCCLLYFFPNSNTFRVKKSPKRSPISEQTAQVSSHPPTHVLTNADCHSEDDVFLLFNVTSYHNSVVLCVLHSHPPLHTHMITNRSTRQALTLTLHRITLPMRRNWLPPPIRSGQLDTKWRRS